MERRVLQFRMQTTLGWHIESLRGLHPRIHAVLFLQRTSLGQNSRSLHLHFPGINRQRQTNHTGIRFTPIQRLLHHRLSQHRNAQQVCRFLLQRLDSHITYCTPYNLFSTKLHISEFYITASTSKTSRQSLLPTPTPTTRTTPLPNTRRDLNLSEN